MRRFFSFLGVLCVAMPVWAGADIATTYATWKTLRDPDASAVRFRDGTQFLADHPGWPEEKVVRIHTEAAAISERPDHEAMAKFCSDFPPISGRGMIACVTADAVDDTKRAEWLKRAWVQGDFNDDEEDRILRSYGQILTRADSIARIDRLIYEGKLPAAKRMLGRLPADRRHLFEVRMAFLANDRKAPKMLKGLSAAQQRDPGMLFERLRWRLRRNDDALADLLLAAPKTVPYPDLWWPMRANAARTAIGKRNYTQAFALIANHGELKDEALADALWMKGWLHLEHKGDAGTAYKEFFQLYTSVSTPVSKARAAYWAARAAEKNGNHDIAMEWLEKAARHPTVFYGQLAYAWLKPKTPLTLPKPPEAIDTERTAFEADERVAVARMLDRAGDEKMRDLFITAIANHASTPGELALVTDLAHDLGGTPTGVEAAKLALRADVVILPAGWPRVTLPENLAIEPALALAISRQESQFNPKAQSPADAHGLMQLLPVTARHVAAQMGLTYRTSMLNDPLTNLSLGSHYLGQIIDGFDGSYILGIASYNAGPGNVRGWLKTLGQPPKNTERAIDWVESIPYGETRNYVMRVLENVSIYRTLENPDAPLNITGDLIR